MPVTDTSDRATRSGGAAKRVTGAQNVSSMCLICGRDNPSSLKARFYELEDGELLGVFAPLDIHQSYPGRVHGGVITAMLDETIGRAVNLDDLDAWGVTVEITVRFRKPVPVGQEVRVLARITKDSRRLFEGSGEIVLADGTVAAEATGRYMKLGIDKISEGDFTTQWFTDERERPETVTVPG